MLKRCATILFLYYTGYPPSGKGALKLSNLAHTDSMINEIRELLLNARQRVAVQVNTELLSTYWNVGKIIVEHEQESKDRADYGKQTLKELSKELTKEFGKGFSVSNLQFMRRFYQSYQIQQTVSVKLSWSHYCELLTISDPDKRSFYEKETINSGWSIRELKRQISTSLYERLLLSEGKTNKETVLALAEKGIEMTTPSDIIKDPYVLEFLGLKDNTDFRENELEQAIIDKLQNFLQELGKGFAFVGRQYRLTTDTGKHFYADLVFYNYILKFFLIIDLKAEPLTHQDIGQMDMYVRYFEDKMRQETDNPTIGLILCTEKDKTIVKYSLLNDSNQIFASKYMLYLPTEQELKKEIERQRVQIEQERKLNQ